MRIGDGVILHSNPFPWVNPEHDKFVLVTISEERKTRGMWGKDSFYSGFTGVDASGRKYRLNWDYYPDDSLTPMWLWDGVDSLWYDVTQGMTAIPRKPRIVDEYRDIVFWCDTHKRLNYPRSNRTLDLMSADAGSTFEGFGYCTDCLHSHAHVNGVEGFWNNWF